MKNLRKVFKMAIVAIAAVTVSLEAQAQDSKMTIKSLKQQTQSSFVVRASGGGTKASIDLKKFTEKLDVTATTSNGREVKLSTSVLEWFKDGKVEQEVASFHADGAKISPLEFSEGCYFTITVTHNGKKYECKFGIGSEFNYIEEGGIARILVKGNAFTEK